MFLAFEFICSYINELLIITKGDWSNHLNQLELTLKEFKDKGLKCNIEKSFIGTDQDGISGFLGDLELNRFNKKESRIHSKYDATKNSKTSV